MDNFLSHINLRPNESTYVKDPESSDLGKSIVTGSISLMDELGFEAFTFRKLAQKIGTTEASVYRYFESKHKLLLYLASWYWSWIEYKIVFAIANVESPEERLKRSIELLTTIHGADGSFEHINETELQRIVNHEFTKAYQTKNVDQENKDGVFLTYKSVVARVSEIIKEINPNYLYPHMLVSTMIEGAHHQRFFADHLPRLTNVIPGTDSVTCFYRELVFKAIEA